VNHKLRSLVLVFISLAVLAEGCANRNYSARAVQDSASPSGSTASPAAVRKTAAEEDSTAALQALWRERTENQDLGSGSGFSLGPGDVLRISVPMIKELTDQTVRVSEDSTIALPLLGTIKVSGMTEQDLRQELATRLSRYMYNPQVVVYLQTPENRVVSVLGSIKAPGRYLIASRSDTIMTLLSRAGGTLDTAGSQILLFPAPQGHLSSAATKPVGGPSANPGEMRESANIGLAAATTGGDESSAATESDRGAPLVISMTGPERYLEMPVRPGDVLFVPAAGSVSVQGWVDKPGIFPITPGMTALGSVAAAGGALFTSSATLIRAEPGGHREQIALNLGQIKRGQQPDVLVRGGDVIIVERSVVGAIPYSLYFMAKQIGVGVPIMP
jgi:protein involved in polysaccharide export with SLBB domain